MYLTKNKSSQIKTMGYDDATSQMYVQFNNDEVYRYLNVNKIIFEQIITADSAGKAFNTLAKHVFTYQKVEIKSR
jgi:hypothetical protein